MINLSEKTQWLEKDISAALVTYLEELRADGELTFFVNLEGGRRDVRQQVSMKRQGARAGRPDIEIFAKNGRVFFIELKRLRGGRLTGAQAGEIAILKKFGFDCHVIRALQGDDAIDQVHDILFGGEHERAAVL